VVKASNLHHLVETWMDVGEGWDAADSANRLPNPALMYIEAGAVDNVRAVDNLLAMYIQSSV